MDNLEQLFYNPTMGKVLFLVIGCLIIYFAVRILRHYFARRIKDIERRYRLRKGIVFLGYLAAILLTIAVFGRQLSGFSVMLGVIVAGIAFALQEVIVSVAGWLALTFSNFYHVGDRVQLGGIKGDVIDIGVLRTTLMECGEWIDADLYTGRIVRIANSFVFKEPVFNYSADFHFLWDEITIPIKYSSDRQLAVEILQRVADDLFGEYAAEAKKVWQYMMETYMIVAADTSPKVTLVANDNWLEYTVRYVVKYTTRRQMKSQLYSHIMNEIDQTDGRVAIASTTIHIVEAPPLDMHVSGQSKVSDS